MHANALTAAAALQVLGRETLLQSCTTLDGPTKRSAQELIVKTFGGSLGGSGGGTIAASRPGTAGVEALNWMHG